MQVACLGVGTYTAWLYTRPFSWGAFLLQCVINIVILEVVLGLLSVILVYGTIAIWSRLGGNSKGIVVSEKDQMLEAYKQQWNDAEPQHRHEIVWRIHHFQRFVAEGLTAQEARIRANALNYEPKRSQQDSEENA